jgi:hypothetical protein
MRWIAVYVAIFYFALAPTVAQEKDASELQVLKQEVEKLKQEIQSIKQEKESKKKSADEEIDEGMLEIDLHNKPAQPAQKQKSVAPKMTIEEELQWEQEETQFYLKGTEASNKGLLQQTSEKVTNGSVILSGFFTLEFRDLQSEDSSMRFFPGVSPQSTFNNSHINLYLDAKFLSDFRFFTELRFVYHPDTQMVESLGKVNHTSEVVIERAWVDWLFRDWLSVRLGNFLVPYGIWNQEHGDPILISTFTPVLLRREIFPERNTGIQLYGRLTLDEWAILYYAWIGNGKGPRLSTEDDQNNKALGARLEVKFPDLKKLTGAAFGVSGYIGKMKPTALASDELQTAVFNIYNEENNLDALQKIILAGYDAAGDPLGEFREYALSFDLRFRFYNFFFQTELVMNGIEPVERVDVPVDTNGDGVADTTVNVKPNFCRQYGAYIQGAYEFDLAGWGQLTPFMRFDWLEGNDRVLRDISTFTILITGVNWKPNSNVALKAEYHIYRFRDAHQRDLEGFYSSFTVSF